MNNKNSFVLYTDYNEQLKLLTNEQKGILFQSIFDYVISNATQIDDPLVNMAFTTIRIQLDKDLKKYEDKCKKLRENADKRWNSNVCKSIQMDSNVCKSIQIVSDNDNDNDNYNDNVLLSEERRPKSKQTVIDYCKSQKLSKVDPISFFNYYEGKKWTSGNKPISDWRSLISTWDRNIKVKIGFSQRSYDFDELEKEILAN